jgi:pyruvate kinase
MRQCEVGNRGSEPTMTTPPATSEGDTQIDGIFGPVTKTAVEYPRDSHLAVDDIVGPATWAALGSDGARPLTLGDGLRWPVAGKLQTALNEGRGDFAPGCNPVLAVDGLHGEQTAAAAKGPQQLGGVQADGVVSLQARRRAKIVCTLGPTTSSPEQVSALVAAGLDVARLNMSHGDHGAHRAAYDAVRAACDASGRRVGVLVDLQGPKIRLGRFAAGPVTLTAGQEFTITAEDVPGDQNEASCSYPGLAGDVRPGTTLLVDDGRVVLEVTAVRGARVRTRVVVGGVVSDHKGLNLPGVRVSVPALTDKDTDDLRWALGLRADMIALSFVQGPEDAEPARKIMDEMGVRLPLIAKIEKPQAVAALGEIVAAFDGIMVARGDLGVEFPLEQVPLVQKRAIKLARQAAKPVIVATQMLESMVSAPRPTRAEASDVANAVLDGADALMLSAETSVGAYPVETVATMARIIMAAEQQWPSGAPQTGAPETTGCAIARAAGEVGAAVGARALVAFTMTGETARRLARYRSPIPLLVFTTESATRSQLALTWGAETFLVPHVAHTDDMVRLVEAALQDIGRCTQGDVVVIVAGSPPGTPGRTNALRVHRIGDAIQS